MPPKRPTILEMQAQCDRFNESHPIGTEVRYHPVIGGPHTGVCVTSTSARILCGHTAVVYLEDRGAVALDAISDIPAEVQG